MKKRISNATIILHALLEGQIIEDEEGREYKWCLSWNNVDVFKEEEGWTAHATTLREFIAWANSLPSASVALAAGRSMLNSEEML